MLRQFPSCHEIVGKSNQQLYNDRVQLGPDISPTSTELLSVKNCVEVLTSVEKATALLGIEKQPPIHTPDVIIALDCKGTIGSTPISSDRPLLEFILQNSTLSRRDLFLKDCDLCRVDMQVASLLTPFYRRMTHLSYLSPYPLSNEDALLNLALVSRELRSPAACHPTRGGNGRTDSSMRQKELHTL